MAKTGWRSVNEPWPDPTPVRPRAVIRIEVGGSRRRLRMHRREAVVLAILVLLIATPLPLLIGKLGGLLGWWSWP